MIEENNQTENTPTSRLQLALNVSNLTVAIEFYEKLFTVAPAKVRDGYANFVVADPPLKLVLFENIDAPPLNHLGVEVADSESVEHLAGEFVEKGLTTRNAMKESCCHSVQDKVYVTAPDVPVGTWEFYTVLEGADGSESASQCCSTAASGSSCC